MRRELHHLRPPRRVRRRDDGHRRDGRCTRRVRFAYAAINADGTTTSEGSSRRVVPERAQAPGRRVEHQSGSYIPVGGDAQRTFAFDDGDTKCGTGGTQAIAFVPVLTDGTVTGADLVNVHRDAADTWTVTTTPDEIERHRADHPPRQGILQGKRSSITSRCASPSGARRRSRPDDAPNPRRRREHCARDVAAVLSPLPQLSRRGRRWLPVNELSASLSRLIQAGSPQDADAAWRAFVAEHSRLVLHVCRSVWRSARRSMDAYAQVLEHLRADDYRRLREFAARAALPRVHLAGRRVAPRLSRPLSPALRAPRAEDGATSSGARAAGCRISSPSSSSCTSPRRPERDEADARAPPRGAARRAAARAHRPRCARLLLLKLRFVDDLAAQEIARLLDYPSPFHVYRRLNALLAELRRTLQPPSAWRAPLP